MRGLILGFGEIGSAYYKILKPNYPKTYRLDILPERTDKKLPESIDILHVCLRYDNEWLARVREIVYRFHPKLINVMSTTPPGTTDKLFAEIGVLTAHSTTRGLHPNLADFIRVTPKHIGGSGAEAAANYFRAVGLECITHKRAATTEALHIASNAQYAASIAFASELEIMLRYYGVDWFDFERYSYSHNLGYERMGMSSKFRPILSPPGNRIGGHCVVQSTQLIPEDIRGPIMKRIIDFNK